MHNILTMRFCSDYSLLNIQDIVIWFNKAQYILIDWNYMLIMHNFAWHYKIVNLWTRKYDFSQKRLFSRFQRIVFLLGNVIPNPKKRLHKYRRMRLTLWKKGFLQITWVKTIRTWERLRTKIFCHWSREKWWYGTWIMLSHTIFSKGPFFVLLFVFLSGSYYSIWSLEPSSSTFFNKISMIFGI